MKEWVQEKSGQLRGGSITKKLYEQIVEWRAEKEIVDDILLLGDGLKSEAIAKALQRTKKSMQKDNPDDKWWTAV